MFRITTNMLIQARSSLRENGHMLLNSLPAHEATLKEETTLQMSLSQIHTQPRTQPSLESIHPPVPN